MPLYDFRCPKGHVVERLLDYDERNTTPRCPCGEVSTVGVSMPAKTAFSWGDSAWTGKRDRALGVTYRDKAHRTAIMHERGLRELQPGEVEAEQRRSAREHTKHVADMKTFETAMAETNNSEVAMARTFPHPEL